MDPDPIPGTPEATSAVFMLLRRWLFLEPSQRVVPSAIPDWEPDFGNVGEAWDAVRFDVPDKSQEPVWMKTMRTSFAHQYSSDYEDVQAEAESSPTQSSSRSKSQPKQGA